MPTIRVNGTNLHYKKWGDSPESILFSHGFLFNKDMFAYQIDHLKDRYTCIAYDHRGQGQSERTTSGYDIDNLTLDAEALIEALEIDSCHFVGLSMGGFVGLRLAIRHPHLLRSLVLMETSADAEPGNKVFRYKLLAYVGRWLGLRLVIGQVMPIMFGQKFLNDPAREKEKNEWRQFMLTFDKPTLPKVLNGVTSRQSVFNNCPQISVPTLIIIGSEDAAYSPQSAAELQKQIPGAKLTVIPEAGHSSTIEEPAAVNAAIDSFLNDLHDN